MDMTDEQLKQQLLDGGAGPFKFSGLLNLDNTTLTELPDSLSCYELSAKNSKLTKLPDDIQVTSRISLDDSADLSYLPTGLTTGSLSLVGCNAIDAIPEGINVWFLNLDNCTRFKQWPAQGNLQGGTLSLRNCIDLTSLPEWLTTLANLDISGCALLNTLPNGMSVTGWIDVGGSGVTQLPQALDGVPVHWRGVPVSRDIAFNPEQITSQAILSTPNAELRRVMIERMGYLEFSKDAGAKSLDTDTDAGGARQLLRIELSDDEPLVGLFCSCPSTGRQYFLRVPPATKSCHQAAAWIAGYDDDSRYNPIVET